VNKNQDCSNKAEIIKDSDYLRYHWGQLLKLFFEITAMYINLISARIFVISECNL
jgi:hypothetical protein